jgi:NAD dependent epimerase/dehydratase family enzyme
MKVLLTGASGMIGTALITQLRARGDEVRRLVRREPTTDTEYQWAAKPGTVPPEAIEWADAVIGLSGAPLGRIPWTASYRKIILRSRIRPTEALARAIAGAQNAPKVWLNASAVGFYGPARNQSRPFTESDPPGSGFLAEVVRHWEQATGYPRLADTTVPPRPRDSKKTPEWTTVATGPIPLLADSEGQLTGPALPGLSRTRIVLLRTGMVLAPEGSLAKVAKLAKVGLAGKLGTGRQY